MATWGRWMVRFRWWVLAVALALSIVAAAWGSGVFQAVTNGGYEDPNSPASKARERISREFGNQDADVVVLYSHPTWTLADPAFHDPVAAALAALRARPEVASVASYYDTQLPQFASSDRHATYAVVRLASRSEDGKLSQFDAIKPVARAGAVRTTFGGLVAFQQEANRQAKVDLEKAELLSLPALLVLLIIIFGGVVAASMPLVIGGLAILSAFAAVRTIAEWTDVSVFAINIVTLVGLGVAIDYALFIVSRFREELIAGATPEVAVERTLATAGRTVIVSGLTVALSLAGLLIFPQALLRSMGLGGMAAVLLAMIASVTVLPALLVALGPRVNAWQIPLPWRRGDSVAGPGGEGGWAAVAQNVMRRPVWYAVFILVVLAILADPFRSVSFGGIDERVLPTSAGARAVATALEHDFPGGSTAPISVLVSAAASRGAASQGTVSQSAVADVLQQIRGLPKVTSAEVTAANGGSFLISVSYRGEAAGGPARSAVRAIRALRAPPGTQLGVAGRTADLVDLLDELGDRLPIMAVIVLLVTFVVLFLAFGSVVLPVKAMLMNVISISASFGLVVWVFQQGHLRTQLHFTPTGFVDPSILILMLAILFGLSTDYEVFLLSRIREEWDVTGDNERAVADGLQRTGGIITSAALLLMVVIAGFTTGEVLLLKMTGVGMLVAIFIDATMVRALLVPAIMRLLGRWNWWAPGPLARLYRRYGLHETARPTVSS